MLYIVKQHIYIYIHDHTYMDLCVCAHLEQTKTTTLEIFLLIGHLSTHETYQISLENSQFSKTPVIQMVDLSEIL